MLIPTIILYQGQESLPENKNGSHPLAMMVGGSCCDLTRQGRIQLLLSNLLFRITEGLIVIIIIIIIILDGGTMGDWRGHSSSSFSSFCFCTVDKIILFCLMVIFWWFLTKASNITTTILITHHSCCSLDPCIPKMACVGSCCCCSSCVIVGSVPTFFHDLAINQQKAATKECRWAPVNCQQQFGGIIRKYPKPNLQPGRVVCFLPNFRRPVVNREEKERTLTSTCNWKHVNTCPMMVPFKT
jgi:hypothetical protein